MILLQKGLYKFSASDPPPGSSNNDEDDDKFDATIKTEVEDMYEVSEYHEDGVIEPEVKILDESEFLDFSGDLDFGMLEAFKLQQIF